MGVVGAPSRVQAAAGSDVTECGSLADAERSFTGKLPVTVGSASSRGRALGRSAVARQERAGLGLYLGSAHGHGSLLDVEREQQSDEVEKPKPAECASA